MDKSQAYIEGYNHYVIYQCCHPSGLYHLTYDPGTQGREDYFVGVSDAIKSKAVDLIGIADNCKAQMKVNALLELAEE